MDHARAFGDAGEADDAAPQRHFARSAFGLQVGGQDGSGDIGKPGIVQPFDQFGEFGEDEVLIQLDSDHAGRSGQHLVRLQLQQLRQRLRGVRGNFVSCLRRAVCIACIDENRAANPFGSAHIGAREFHGRGLHSVGREHCRGRGRYARNNQGKVVLFLFANASVGGGIFKS